MRHHAAIMSANAPTTPCIGICRLDTAGARCLGCGRTLEQIAGWSGYSEAERLRIMAALRCDSVEDGRGR